MLHKANWLNVCPALRILTHWGRVTHVGVSKLTIIGSDNCLSPSRCLTIIWTNVGIFLIWPLAINFTETSVKIRKFLFVKMHLKISSGKWWPFVSASMCWWNNTKQAENETGKRPVTMLNALMNTALLHRCSYTSEYNAKPIFSCIWD